MNDQIQIENVSQLLKNSFANSGAPFNKKERINFAYKYWNLTDYEIEDLFTLIASEMKKDISFSEMHHYYLLLNDLIKFIKKEKAGASLRYTKGLIEKDIQTINIAANYSKEKGGWLHKYDIEKEFNVDWSKRLSLPVYYSYLTKDGGEVKMNYQTVESVLETLNDNNIPLAECIVKNSFHHYAFGTLDDYINNLHDNDEKIKQIENKVLKKHIK